MTIPNIDKTLKGLEIQKARITMVDEMARRVNVNQTTARRLLAQELVYSKRENREFDMTWVARAIYALKGK